MLAAAVVAVVSVFYDLDEVIICLILCNPTEAIHSFFLSMRVNEEGSLCFIFHSSYFLLASFR